MKFACATLLGLAFVAVTFVNPAASAGPFDGQWEGIGKATAKCGEQASISMTIKDNAITRGSLKGPRGQGEVSGEIKPDGSSKISLGRGKFWGNLKFEGDSFAGKIDTLCGTRDFEGKRDK